MCGGGDKGGRAKRKGSHGENRTGDEAGRSLPTQIVCLGSPAGAATFRGPPPAEFFYSPKIRGHDYEPSLDAASEYASAAA